MFCKQCGTKMDNDAKFCPSCGVAVEQTKQYTAPRPFERNSVDESQNFQYQKSAFKGKQVSTGTSGSISFGSHTPKKRGLIGRLIKLAIIAGVLLILYNVFFSGGPVYNVDTGTGVDATTGELVGEATVFSSSEPFIYVVYNNDLEPGTVLTCDWYYFDETLDQFVFIDSATVTIVEDMGTDYFFMNRPTNGWPVGDYDIDFVVDGETLHTEKFSVE